MVTLAGWVLLMSEVPMYPSTRCVRVRQRLVYEMVNIIRLMLTTVACLQATHPPWLRSTSYVEIPGHRCRANVEPRGQSIPEFGLGFQKKVLSTSRCPLFAGQRTCLAECIDIVVWQKSIPPQIRQLVL